LILQEIVMDGITKTEYKAARKLIRTNGRYALRWMSDAERAVFESLEAGKDWLAERASIVAWCKRTGTSCNPRQTARGAC